MESNRVCNQTRDLQNQTTTKRWSDLLITSMRQTELDDTKSFYELIKTMKKLQKQTNRRLYIFIKSKTTAYVIANICHKRVTTTTFYNLKFANQFVSRCYSVCTPLTYWQHCFHNRFKSWFTCNCWRNNTASIVLAKVWTIECTSLQAISRPLTRTTAPANVFKDSSVKNENIIRIRSLAYQLNWRYLCRK